MRNKIKYCLATNLERLLVEKDLSQGALASKLKINKSTLHGYLHGVIPQSLISLKKIADFFDVSLDELLFGENSRQFENKEDNKKYEITIKRVD